MIFLLRLVMQRTLAVHGEIVWSHWGLAPKFNLI